MDYVEELDQANAANYQKIKESLKKDIQERTDEAVAQAPSVVKSAVQAASEELQDKMEDFSRTETENVPSPPTWVTFAAENKSAIEKRCRICPCWWGEM